MKNFLFVILIPFLFSCSSDSLNAGQKEIASMFGAHKIEEGVSPKNNEAYLKVTFSNPEYVSDSTNRPGIVGTCAILLYKNLSEEEKVKYANYDFTFEGNGKKFDYGLNKKSILDLISFQNQATEFANMLCMGDYRGLADNYDSTYSDITADTLKATFSDLTMEVKPMDSIKYYASYPAEIKRNETSVKTYRFSAFLYQGKRTYKYFVTIERSKGKIESMRCIQKKEQREFSLPL